MFRSHDDQSRNIDSDGTKSQQDDEYGDIGSFLGPAARIEIPTTGVHTHVTGISLRWFVRPIGWLAWCDGPRLFAC